MSTSTNDRTTASFEKGPGSGTVLVTNLLTMQCNRSLELSNTRVYKQAT